MLSLRPLPALSVLVSGALAASVLAFVSPAGAADNPAPKSGAAVSGPRDGAAAASEYAAGVIVTTTDGRVSSSLRAAASDLADVAVAGARTAGGAKVIDFAEPIPLAEAREVAAELADRADVVKAEPNTIFQALANPPVSRNDTYFKQQYGVWDRRGTFQGLKMPVGGYSVRAPYLWRATAGKSSVRVAVIDTGITNHSDLAGQTVPGYDFFSNTGINEGLDRDGTPGRDSNPADPGDYKPSVNYCSVPEEGSNPPQSSSWHGTHVAGIIAARTNNKKGIAGIASGVRIQPIRVLGPCGGTLADIADAIVWASGGPVSGVPTNTRPSKIINLSLGGSGACQSTYQTAINKARSRGSVVVAAAGNDSDDETFYPISQPANCGGVIAVVASDEVGQVTTYSNIGTNGTEPGTPQPNRPANIAAPGGTFEFTGFSGILSTLNAGATTPGSESYAEYQGTSMATPAVAAAASMMVSLGYSRAQTEKGLKYSVRGFPQYTGDFDYLNCDKVSCGRGLLDLSKVPAPYKTYISGTMKKGKKVTAKSYWNGSPKRIYRWYRNGKMISGATKSTYTLKKADKGKYIKVKVWGKKGGFKTLTKTSKSRKVAS